MVPYKTEPVATLAPALPRSSSTELELLLQVWAGVCAPCCSKDGACCHGAKVRSVTERESGERLVAAGGRVAGHAEVVGGNQQL